MFDTIEDIFRERNKRHKEIREYLLGPDDEYDKYIVQISKILGIILFLSIKKRYGIKAALTAYLYCLVGNAYIIRKFVIKTINAPEGTFSAYRILDGTKR